MCMKTSADETINLQDVYIVYTELIRINTQAFISKCLLFYLAFIRDWRLFETNVYFITLDSYVEDKDDSATQMEVEGEKRHL